MTLFVLKSTSLQYESRRQALTPSVFYAESNTQTEIEGLQQVYVPAQTGWQVRYNDKCELLTKLPGTEIAVTLDGMFYPLLAECHPRALIEEVELQLVAILDSNCLPAPAVQRWILLSDSMAARLAVQPEVTLLEGHQFTKKSDIKKGDILVAKPKSSADTLLRVALVGDEHTPSIGKFIHTQWDSLKPGPVIAKDDVVEAPFFRSNLLCVKEKSVQTTFDEMLNYLKLFEHVRSGAVLRMLSILYQKTPAHGYRRLNKAVTESKGPIVDIPLSAKELQENARYSISTALVNSSQFYEVPQCFTEATLSEYFSKKAVLHIGTRHVSFLKLLYNTDSVIPIDGPLELKRSRRKDSVVLGDSAKKAYELLCAPATEDAPDEITSQEAVKLIHALFSDAVLVINSKDHLLELTRVFNVPFLS